VLSGLGRGKGALPPFVSMRPKLENDVPRFVEQSQGQFAGWLGPLHDPLTIDSDPSRPDYRVAETTLHPEISLERLGLRRELLTQLDRRLGGFSPNFAAQDENNRRAFELLTSATTQRGAFNLEEEPPAVRERYGLNPHGQSVLQARRLIERGVPLVTVFWPNDGTKNVSVYWDTHSRNFTDLKTRLMPVADQAFAALLDDLAERGMLEDTLVIWTGEFGRTPRVGQRSSDAGAGKDGRDHWGGCFTSVLAGGGVKGGFVYGKSDKEAAFPAEKPVAPRDLIATVYHLLGVPEEQTLVDMSGRPQFIRTGKVMGELLA
jgi:arylsulfatase A-like enzyme